MLVSGVPGHCADLPPSLASLAAPFLRVGNCRRESQDLFLPVGKRPRILLTSHLGSGLAWGVGDGGERGTPTGSPGGKDECPDRRGKAGQIIRRREGFMVAAEGEKWRGGASREKKMLINDERSRNVYENKQKDDNFTEKKGDISTQRNDILCKSTRILLKSSFFLSRLERWGTDLSLPNVETRDRQEIAGGITKSFPAGRNPTRILLTTYLVFELAFEGDKGRAEANVRPWKAPVMPRCT